jgi:vacuolar-type H+-ATPase subunit I/STV1
MVIFSAACVFAQNHGKGDKNMKPLQKIEEWEKMKLIEVLNLNEDTSVRFFARRNELQKKIREILDQRDDLAKKMEAEFKDDSKVSDAVYQEQVNNLIASEIKIQKEKETYIKGLGDILSPEQIAKLTVFEIRLRREIREKLMRGKDHQ